MRSISTRLAVWYALAATTTLACLFITGYFVLERHLVHGLDMLNVAGLNDIKANLVREHDPDDPAFLETSLRKLADRSAELFYIWVDDDQTGASFSSTNLNKRPITAPPGKGHFNVELPGIGSVRVGSFNLKPYTVKIATPDHDVDMMLEGYSEIALSLLVGMTVASVGIGFWLSRLALRPVRLISETANRIRSDNLGERIKVGKGNDEISDLAIMLNQTFDRLESSFNQIRQFAADASHELKTPLSLVHLYAEKMLLSGELSLAHEESVLLQLEELERLDRIIEEMLFLSRVEAHAIILDLKHENPGAFLQHFAQDASVLAEHQRCQFTYTQDGDGRVGFDSKRMRQVLLNLLSNALRVSPPHGRIMLRSLLENGIWRLSMEDEGPGVPAELHERIFERFVRLNAQGADDRGNGLGLAICRGTVGLHHGRIFATSTASGSGLKVVIEIPAQYP
jgi:two-component system heavy metal sensor histidine kinase CusS